MNKAVKILLAAVCFAAVAAGTLYWLWTIRLTSDAEKSARRNTRNELRSASLDEAASRLDKLYSERSFTVRFGKSFPYLSLSIEPKVPYDFIGLLAEEAFIRLASDLKSPKADTDRRIKELIGFSKMLLDSGNLTQSAYDSLRERRLDGFFLVGDYDNAVAVLEEGMHGRTPHWCQGTIAKLRAHKAMEAGDKQEAIKQLLVFVDLMLSDAMKDFEDSDPANGVVYSREWVAARNLMRCATMSGEIGDAAAKAAHTEKARPLYKTALDKAKDDDISLKELNKEMQSYGL